MVERYARRFPAHRLLLKTGMSNRKSFWISGIVLLGCAAMTICVALVLWRRTPNAGERVLGQILRKLGNPDGITRGFQLEKGVPVYLDANAGVGTIRFRFPEADPARFQALNQPKNARARYAVDGTHVWMAMNYHAQRLNEADGATFSLLDAQGIFARDATQVFHFGVPIKSANPAAFQPLGRAFAKDDRRAYLGTVPFEVRDFATWEPLEAGHAEIPWYRDSNRPPVVVAPEEIYCTGWSRDSRAVYYGTEEVSGADSASFEVLSSGYSKDARQVYFRNKVVAGADPSTFHVLPSEAPYRPGPDAADSTHKFRVGEVDDRP